MKMTQLSQNKMLRVLDGSRIADKRSINKQSINFKEGAKYAAKKYLPPPSKMRGVTFHSGRYSNIR